MQPPTLLRYSPCFASPCAPASAGVRARQKTKSPAEAGRRKRETLKLLPEVIVAAAASLADRTDLRLHGGFVAALADLVELVRLVLEPARRFLELAGVAEHLGQRIALHILGARIEAVPRHAAQVVEKPRVAANDIGVVRELALSHACERPEVLALQRHHGLALLDQGLGLHLSERHPGGNAERQRSQGCGTAFVHLPLLKYGDRAARRRLRTQTRTPARYSRS